MDSLIVGDILSASILTYFCRVIVFCLFLFLFPFRGLSLSTRVAFFVVLLFALAPQHLFQMSSTNALAHDQPLGSPLYFDFHQNGSIFQYRNIAMDFLRLSLIGVFLSTSFFIIQLFGKWLRSMFVDFDGRGMRQFQGFGCFDCLLSLFYLYFIFNVVGVERIISVSQQLFYSELILPSANGEIANLQKTWIGIWTAVLSHSFYLAFILAVPFFVSSMLVDFSYFCYCRFVGMIELYGIYRIMLMSLISSLLFMALWMKFSDIILSSLVTKAFIPGS